MTKIEELDLPIPAEIVARLKQTEQNPRYHAEGNVFDHTLLVLETFFQYSDQFSLSESEKEVLYWAAILHDIGKPLVTKKKNGRWVARGHEIAGVPLARDFLLSREELSTEQRHNILKLVRWHHIPLRWGMVEKPISEYKILATQIDLRLLGIFAFFDLMGRKCETHEQVTEIMGDFNERIVPRIAFDMGVFDLIQSVYEQSSLTYRDELWANVRSNNAHKVERLLLEGKDDLVDESHGTCSWTIGPHGSGKTSFLGRNFEKAALYDTDERLAFFERKNASNSQEKLFVDFEFFLEDALKKGKAMVVDGTNLNEMLRREMVALVRNKKIHSRYCFFEKPLEQCLENSAREPNLVRASYYAQHLLHPWESHDTRYIEEID